jgi:hypothetical protein
MIVNSLRVYVPQTVHDHEAPRQGGELGVASASRRNAFADSRGQIPRHQAMAPGLLAQLSGGGDEKRFRHRGTNHAV